MIKSNSILYRCTKFFRKARVESNSLDEKEAEKKVADAEGLAARFLATKPISNPNILLIVLRPVVVVAIFLSLAALIPVPGTGMNYILGMVLLLVPFYNWHKVVRNCKSVELALLTSDVQHDQLNELVELSNWPNSIVRQVARYHLIRLLRDIAPGEHDEILDANHLSLLVRWLKLYNAIVEPRLTTEILEMFTRTGYAHALPSAIYLSRYSLRLSVRRAAGVCTKSLRGSWRSNVLQSDVKDPGELLPAMEEVAPTPKETHSVGTNRISMRRGFLIASFLVCIPYGIYNITQSVLSHIWIMILPYAFISLCPLLLIGFTIYPADVKRLRAVVKSDKLDSVGMLVEALEWPDFYCQQLAAQGLIKSLPRLKVSDANLLNVRQREILLHKLTYTEATSQPQLLVTILQALEQIGDPAAIAPVERLATGTPKNSGQIRVKEAAIRCLEYLPHRAVLNGANLTLLRATQPAMEDGSDLLRSGSTGSAMSEELLLRPGSME